MIFSFEKLESYSIFIADHDYVYFIEIRHHLQVITLKSVKEVAIKQLELPIVLHSFNLKIWTSSVIPKSKTRMFYLDACECTTLLITGCPHKITGKLIPNQL